MDRILSDPLIIRADAGPTIGTGHVMRCLALAEAWQEAGGTVFFVSVDLPPAIVDRLERTGMQVLLIPGTAGTPGDAGETIHIARKHGAGWIVVDGYQFGSSYQKAIHDSGLSQLFIDDYGHAAHYYADFVLNQNVYAEMSLYPEHEPATRFLLGTRYALLRREFLEYAGFRRTIPPVARKILVTFGGGDPGNLTGAVTQILMKTAVENLEVIVVVGGIFPHIDALRSSVRNYPHISIHNNVTNMPELMAWADVAISAGGTTCWELAFMGLPALLYTAAENQTGIVDTLVAQGMAERLTTEDLTNPTEGLKKISGRLISQEKREAMSQRMCALVDGEGASRVTMIVKNETVRLRMVLEKDCDLIYRWINDPDVRARSFRPHVITPAEHRDWFSSVLANPDIIYFIAVDEHDHPIGQARFCIEGNHAIISVLIEPASRNKGLGSLVIGIATRRLFAKTPIREVHAFIKKGNESSVRAFAKAGYANEGQTTVENQEAYLLIRRMDDN